MDTCFIKTECHRDATKLLNGKENDWPTAMVLDYLAPAKTTHSTGWKTMRYVSMQSSPWNILPTSKFNGLKHFMVVWGSIKLWTLS